MVVLPSARSPGARNLRKLAGTALRPWAALREHAYSVVGTPPTVCVPTTRTFLARVSNSAWSVKLLFCRLRTSGAKVAPEGLFRADRSIFTHGFPNCLASEGVLT